MNVAVSTDLLQTLDIKTERPVTDIYGSDFTDVSAVILSLSDVDNGMLDNLEKKGFGAPVFVVGTENVLPDNVLSRITGVLGSDKKNATFYGRQVDAAASRFEEQVLPPFFGSLVKYVGQGNSQFDCPGHQGGRCTTCRGSARNLQGVQ
ncbi:TPA: Orn/Lys/Arg decarboxylase N-terminal domain-containing protein [Salmonella enterica subsp. diarizonae serovar 60-67:z35:-]